jgi:predicted amidohydrolase YtcJ
MVTRNYWYLTFEEQAKGTIAPARFADIVVLPEDIMTVPAKRIEQMRVMMTMVGGRVVYRDPDFRKISTD